MCYDFKYLHICYHHFKNLVMELYLFHSNAYNLPNLKRFNPLICASLGQLHEKSVIMSTNEWESFVKQERRACYVTISLLYASEHVFQKFDDRAPRP